MAFDNLSTEALSHGSLGTKSASNVNVPEPVRNLIAAAWKHQQEHANQFHRVTLSDKAERDEFHIVAKQAAKENTPELDYRKLPRPGADENVAFFTLREVTPDLVRPGRPKVEKAEEKSDKAESNGKAEEKVPEKEKVNA